MSEAQDTFTRVTFDRDLPFVELHVYAAGLIGFLFFYGLEHMVSRSGQKEGGEGTQVGYRLQLGGFAAYSGLVAYLMVHQRALPTVLYVIAMALHFLGIDHSLGREYGATYHRIGRWVLAAAVLLGGAIGIATSMSEELLATLLGLNSGGVIINSMIMELPKEKEGRFWPFCFGAIAYSILLLLV
jgi:Kef-type K+ transport system membrane component KefB